MSPVHRRDQGFTLIEVMIVVAIVAILAAVAYPSYTEYVRKSRRAEARAQLLEVAQFMQRFYSQNDSFKRAVGATADLDFPATLARVPRQGTQTYTIRIVSDTWTASFFNLEATPSGTMANDRCGKLQIDSTGLRKVVDANGMTSDDCWR
jgi:type IV pilus assembly protein PilE